MMFAAFSLILGLASSPSSGSDAQIGEFRFENFVSRQEGDEVIYIVSDMRFRNETTRLTGDYAVLWLDAAQYAKMFERSGESDKLHRPAMPPPSRGRILPTPPSLLLGAPANKEPAESFSLPADLVREIYVEGAVFFEQGEERLLQGSSVYMDLSSGRALIADGRLQTTKAGLHDTPVPLSVKARWFRREATGRFVADEAQYTTCAYGKPHQHIDSDQIWIEETEAGTGVDAYGSTFRTESVPLFYLPRTVLDPETKDMLFFRGVKFGSTSAFGFFTYTRWGHGFHEAGEDFNEWLFGKKLPFRGDWELRLDRRRKRGEGIGPELSWETPGYYKGQLKTYLTHDAGQDYTFYSKAYEQEEGRRGRATLENRIWFAEEWTFDTELNYVSDPAFLPEFFRNEYFLNKEPETSAYLRWARNNQAFTTLVNAPLNDFDPVPAIGYTPPNGVSTFDPPALKESLPELRHYWFREPVFSLPMPAGTGEFASLPLPVYYTEKSSAGYLRRHPSGSIGFKPGTISFLPADTMASSRFDTEHELSAPFHADPFILTPFLEERYTAYNSDLAGGETSRVVGIGGIRMSTHLEGSPGEGWIHSIDPAVSYENTYAVTKDASELIAFDEVEEVAKREVLLLELRNRLHRVAKEPAAKPGGKTREERWNYPLDLDLRLPIFMEPDRDNAGERYGDLETVLSFETGIQSGPLRRLRGVADLGSSVREPGPSIHRLNFAEVQLGSSPTDDLNLFVSHRRIRDLPNDVDIFTSFGGGFSYKINEKWILIGSEDFNFETHKPNSHNFILRRMGHDWVFEVFAAFNDVTNERIITFNLQPLLRVQRGREFRGLSNFLQSSQSGQQFYTD